MARRPLPLIVVMVRVLVLVRAAVRLLRPLLWLVL